MDEDEREEDFGRYCISVGLSAAQKFPFAQSRLLVRVRSTFPGSVGDVLLFLKIV